MDYIHNLADVIIVSVALYFWLLGVFRGLAAIVDVVHTEIDCRKRNALHKRWVAARVAAREITEAKLRAEGRWDNYEIQDAMKAAGEAVAPGYRV